MRFGPIVLLAIGSLSVTAMMETATATAAQSSASVRQLMEGEQLYRTFCAACHGADARGGGPVAPALKTPPSDLTTIAIRNGGTFARDRWVRYITNGEPAVAAHGTKEMPVWGPNLVALTPPSNKPASERIDAIVAYLRSIQRER